MESKKSDEAKVDFTPTYGSSEKQKTGNGNSFIWAIYLVLKC